MQTEIFIGVLSGVLTAALIYSAQKFWFKILFPWYQEARYQGADVSGSWYSEQSFADESKHVFSMNLKQSAHKITGSIQFTFTSPQRKYSIDYMVSGEYWEGYLNLSCRSKDRRTYAQASMFMKLINNGNGVLGQFSFRDAVHDKVTSLEIGLARHAV